MPADPALLTREARARLLERLAELRGLAELMEKRGTLPSAPEPVPPHRMDAGVEGERCVSRRCVRLWIPSSLRRTTGEHVEASSSLLAESWHHPNRAGAGV